MYTRFHFARQRRQLRYLGKQLLQFRENGQFIPQQLLVRFRRLTKALLPKLGKRGLQTALGSAAILVGFNTAVSAQQTPDFMAPVENPFGIASNVGPTSYYNFPAFADLDGDGDLDLIATRVVDEVEFINGFIYQENTGTPESPSFGPVQSNPFGLENTPADVYSIEFADLDDDGDLDMFAVAFDYSVEEEDEIGKLMYYQNIGDDNNPNFTAFPGASFGLDDGQIDIGNLPIVSFGDLDDDGDLDVIMQNYD
ncbi:MAG: hypothetical protein AAF828_11565, partial [Bacteroidota bacterium]